MTSTPDLGGKIALVTGGSRGIGRQLAIAMARCGATVVVTARNLDSSPGQGGTLRSTVDAIEAEGGEGIAIPATITDPVGAESLVNQARERAGPIDILVNNAAVYPRSLVIETPIDEWEEAVAVNFNAVFYLTRLVLPLMMERQTGRIVSVSTELVLRHRARDAAYAATKSAVDVFSACLAAEVQEYGIEVNTWTPGYVRTDMGGSKARDSVETVEESFMWMLAQQPMALTGRILRKPDFGQTWGPGIPL